MRIRKECPCFRYGIWVELMADDFSKTKRVLIFRVGSLGDTLVALPAFRLIADSYPNSERRLLTHLSENQKATPAQSILDGTGFVHGYYDYSTGAKTIKGMIRLSRQIRAWKPDVLIYLMEPKGLFRTLRDAAYFKWVCGIPHIIGLPVARDKREVQPHGKAGYVEREAKRLLRCLEELGEVDPEDLAFFRLRLSEEERSAAARKVKALPEKIPIISVSIGAKCSVKDWEDANWVELFRRLGGMYPGHALVMIGAKVERQRSEKLLNNWRGPTLNLCGELSPRESAAVLQNADIFIGHDSGPVHLAASVGTRCVAIFSSRNPPGEWFPLGEGHHILYHQVPCSGCKLDVCRRYNKRCILSIQVDEVINAAGLTLEAGSPVDSL